MKKLVRVLWFVLFALAWPPTSAFAEDAGAERCRALVLIYHRIDQPRPGDSAVMRANTVSPEWFDAQMKFLVDNGYPVVAYGDVAACLNGGAALPERAVAVTFDDGSHGQYRYALPTLEKYGLTATFFLVTDAVAVGHEITWDEARDLDARGMTVGSHTVSHRYLPSLPDTDLARELAESKRAIEGQLGHPIAHFAYPFGMTDLRAADAVRAAGYASARGAAPAGYRRPNVAFNVNATGVGNGLAGFIALVTRYAH